jgi:hypothetical protein
MRNCLKSLVLRPRILWSYVPLRTSTQVLRFEQYFAGLRFANEICFLLLIKIKVSKAPKVIFWYKILMCKLAYQAISCIRISATHLLTP